MSDRSGRRWAEEPPPPIRDPAPPVIPDHAVLGQIGHGSYGEVWLAKSALGKMRAVKVVRHKPGRDDVNARREYAGLCRYESISRSHPGLVQILQAGHNEAEAYFYYVMELADPAAGRGASDGSDSEPGLKFVPRTLRHDLEQCGRLPVRACIELGLQLAEAIGYLHRQKLLHRDIKPANIIFVEGKPKLADIGLVAEADDARSFVGTEGYVPPEGHGNTGGDLYSLGKVLYECATGKDRKEYPALPANIAHLPDRAELAEFNEFLLKACDEDRSGRYDSADQFRDHLRLLDAGGSLRRLRRLEKFKRRTLRLVVVVGLIATVLAAWLIAELRHVRIVGELAKLNRDRLIRLQVENGLRAMNEGESGLACLWFSKALEEVAGVPADEWVHRRRLGAMLEKSPQLVAIGSHRDKIRSIQFSPDGQSFATASADGTVRFWDATTGKERGPGLLHGKPVEGLRFSPDGRHLATIGEDELARVWEVASRRLKWSLPGHSNRVNAIAFDRQGALLATASEDCTARIWDLASGRSLAVLPHSNAVNQVEFSPDGRHLATSSDDDTAAIWRLGPALTAPLSSLRLTHSNDVRSAQFSPDGQRIVTASKDGTARVWEVSTGKPITAELRLSVPLWVGIFSPDGRSVLTAGGDGDRGGEARVWDAERGHPVTPIVRHGNTIRSAVFSPDGSIFATASHDRSVALWAATSGKRMGPPLESAHFMKWLSFSAKGDRILAAGDDQSWRLWDIRAAQSPSGAPARTFPLGRARISPSGRMVFGVDANGAAVFQDIDGARPPAVLDRHSAEVVWTVFSPDGTKVATACRDGTARVWDCERRRPLTAPMTHSATNGHGLALFSSDGKSLATLIDGRERTVKIWDLEKGGTCRLTLPHDFSVRSADFSPDGKWLLTGGGDEGGRAGLVVWSLEDGRPRGPVLTHPSQVHDVQWVLEGKRIVTLTARGPTDSTSARIWNFNDLGPGRDERLPGIQVPWRMAVPGPAELFATGSTDGEVRVWNSRTLQPVSRSFHHGRSIWVLEFSPDGRQLATPSPWGQTWLLDPQTGDPLGPPLRHPGWLDDTTGVSFSRDGTFLLISSAQNSTLWHLATPHESVETLVARAQLVAGRRLDGTGNLTRLTSEEMADLLRIANPRTARATPQKSRP